MKKQNKNKQTNVEYRVISFVHWVALSVGGKTEQPVIGLGALEHAAAAADWCFTPLEWLDSAASPVFEMSNVLRHSVPFARHGS